MTTTWTRWPNSRRKSQWHALRSDSITKCGIRVPDGSRETYKNKPLVFPSGRCTNCKRVVLSEV